MNNFVVKFPKIHCYQSKVRTNELQMSCRLSIAGAATFYPSTFPPIEDYSCPNFENCDQFFPKYTQYSTHYPNFLTNSGYYHYYNITKIPVFLIKCSRIISC
jgi:hypothetical protein